VLDALSWCSATVHLTQLRAFQAAMMTRTGFQTKKPMTALTNTTWLWVSETTLE